MKASSVLPQSGYMVFIDEILEVRDGFVRCKYTPKDGCIFAQDGAIDSSVYIEIMAQAIAAYSGMHAGSEARIGFLLGVRNFEIFAPTTKLNTCIIASASESMSDGEGMYVFDCELASNGATIAHATLSVINPSDEFLEKIDG